MPSAPVQIGPYELLLPLGTGGVATVYLARLEAKGASRHVALKLLHPHLRDEPEQVDQILHEARVAALVRHPNVVHVFDVGEDPPHLVMHYVEGEVLSALMRTAEQEKTRIPRRIALRIVVDMLAGLHAAHEVVDEHGRALRLVHRDVSPQNVLIGVDGVSQLADFGIAKVATRDGLTRAGVVKGKVAYMSPEQARARPIDRRSDVFAAAVVAWEVLAGRSMYPAGKSAAIMSRIISDDAPRLSSVEPGIARALDDALAAALARDVDARTPSADAFRRAILDVAEDEIADVGEVAAYVQSAAAEALARRREAIRSATGEEVTTPLVSLREIRVARSVDPAVDYDTPSRPQVAPPLPPVSAPPRPVPSAPRLPDPMSSSPSVTSSSPWPSQHAPRASAPSLPSLASIPPAPLSGPLSRNVPAPNPPGPNPHGPGSPTVLRVFIVLSLLLAAGSILLLHLLSR